MGLVFVYCVFISGLIVATFIDFEHLIIPDGITIGGMVAGVLASLILAGVPGQTVLAGTLFTGVAILDFGLPGKPVGSAACGRVCWAWASAPR